MRTESNHFQSQGFEDSRIAALYDIHRRCNECGVSQKVLEEVKAKNEAKILFQMGQQAYGRGVYDKSVEMLEAALTKVSRASNVGGEVCNEYCCFLGLDRRV